MGYNSPSCKNTNDFNLGKCLNDCFNKSSIKHDSNKKFDDINDDENYGAIMDTDDDEDNEENEKELLERLDRLRNNEKTSLNFNYA